MIPGLSIIGSVVKGLFGIADKMIVDKDKKAEFAFKIQDRTFNLMERLVEIKTIPWVDAVVKLLIASVSLARPIGSFLLTAFSIYAQVKGIQLDSVTNGVLLSAFPGWMAAREANKSRKAKIKREAIIASKQDSWDDDDDW